MANCHCESTLLADDLVPKLQLSWFTPVHMPVDTPVDMPVHTPVYMPADTPVHMPVDMPVHMPIHMPFHMPNHTPVISVTTVPRLCLPWALRTVTSCACPESFYMCLNSVHTHQGHVNDTALALV